MQHNDNNIKMNYIYLLRLYPSNPDNIVKLGRTSKNFIEQYNDYKCYLFNIQKLLMYMNIQ